MSRKAKATVEMIHHYANLGDPEDAELAQRQRAERRVLALAVAWRKAAQDACVVNPTAQMNSRNRVAFAKFVEAVHALPDDQRAKLEAEAKQP